MDKAYDHKKVEDRIYKDWEEKGYFKAKPDSSKKPYGILIPPPNVNGPLHLGHAMQHAILDAIARFKRMQGFDVLLLPGVDHAGILFEGTLNKILEKEGTSKQKLGREAWMKRAWEFKDENYKAFHETWKVMGLSADWSREVFTLDPKVQKAVFHEFKTFWDQGLLYKGAYIVQWCPKDQTAIEDLEMEYQERKEKLYFVKYLIQDSKDQYISVATARPETIFADVAIAVHPTDKKYSARVGKRVVNPLNGLVLPIIKDSRVDKKFGTGALKITPGHDPLDYEIGKDNNLGIIHAIDKTGKMTVLAEELIGLKVMDARKRAVEILKENGSLEKEEEYTHSVPVCERCKTTIEPLISEEWFVKMKPLAEKALKNMNKINFLPKNYKKIISDWLKNIHDWSISRSLWWGHRIPAWYCIECNKDFIEITVKDQSKFTFNQLPTLRAKFSYFLKRWDIKKILPEIKEYVISSGATSIISQNDPGICPKCGGTYLQDPQVLDTWFSSGLWPMVTLGWPDNTRELEKYFPWDFELTAPEIKFLWIARMIMLGLWFKDEIPFKNMFFHGMLRDLQGRKFSKSLGNGIDPYELRNQWGTDATRMALYTYSIPGRDGKTSKQLIDERAKNYRNFGNKLWNIARFIEMKKNPGMKILRKNIEDLNGFDGTTDDMKMVQRTYELVSQVTYHIDSFRLHYAIEKLYEFVWHEFADIYIESLKKRTDPHAYHAAIWIFDIILRLLHPFMPFITEELYSRLGFNKAEGYSESLMIEKWPFDSV